MKERTWGRETGLVGFLNSNPSYQRDIRGTESDKDSVLVSLKTVSQPPRPSTQCQHHTKLDSGTD